MPDIMRLLSNPDMQVKRVIRNDKAVAEFVLRDDDIGVIEAVYASPRVLSQTPKAGTPIARGATVNLVLGNGRTIPGKAVGGGHTRWQNETLGKAYDDFIKDDQVMTNLVAKYGEQQNLTQAERTQAEQILTAKGVQLGAGAGNDLDSAMTSLGAANAFNGVAG